MNTISIVILVIIGVIILSIGTAIIGAGLGLITIPWLKFTSQIQMSRDITSKTYNADNAIYNYHWFQETAGQLTALQQSIVQSQQQIKDFKSSASGDMSSWSYAETTEYARLNSVLLGQEQQYNSVANDYNAKAGEADRSIFVNNLPMFFNLQPY